VLHRIALLAVAAPRRVIVVASLMMIGAAVFGGVPRGADVIEQYLRSQ